MTSTRRRTIAALAALYLGAVILANLLASHYGVWITPYVAFALIGADLTTRDVLHEQLDGPRRWAVLGALIAAGGAVSYALSASAGLIAVASVTAFVAAGVVDTLVYALLWRAAYDTRVGASNVAAAAVDSVLFLWIAFDLVGTATFLQFVAKVAGGAVWLLVFRAVGSCALLARHA